MGDDDQCREGRSRLGGGVAMAEFRILPAFCEGLHGYINQFRAYVQYGIDEPQYTKRTLGNRVSEVLGRLAENAQRDPVRDLLGADTIVVPGQEGER